MEYIPWFHRNVKAAFSTPGTILAILGAFTFILSAQALQQTNHSFLLQRLQHLDLSETRLTLLSNTPNSSASAVEDFTASSGQLQNNAPNNHGNLRGTSMKKNRCLENSKDQESGTKEAISQTHIHKLSRRGIQTSPTSTTQRSSTSTEQPRQRYHPGARNSPKNPITRCQPRNLQNISNTEGHILWTESRSVCYDSYLWLITVPDGNGIVFTFTSIKMLNSWDLMVQEVNSQTMIPKTPPLWKYLDGNFMAPLLVRNQQLLLEVKKAFGQKYVPNTNRSSDFKPANFNLSYAAHPGEFMPQEVQADDGDGFRSSRVMYNCSLYPKRIPEALQCDMIQQCVAGEDEEDCSYRSAGCGDWVPYRDQCLRAFFKPIKELVSGRSHVTMPIPAGQACRTNFRAKLALLPDLIGMQLASKFVHHSGYHSATVGLRKMRPRSSKVKQLYKYVWQWGLSGSPVAYEQVMIQRNNPVTDCAVFDLTADSHLKPLHCTVASSVESVPEGIICMKPNASKRRQKIEKLKFLHLQPAAKHVTVFPTKKCPDGSLVQTFHACQWNGFAVSQLQQPSVFPNFQCQLGHSVHYSFVCDAVDDCADGSDEVNCMAPQFEPLLNATFTCTNLQTISKKKGCNGINDCFDSSDEEDCITCSVKTVLCPSQGCVPKRYREYFQACQMPGNKKTFRGKESQLKAVDFDGFGMFHLERAGVECSEGYFQCDSHLCIPTFLLNNGEQDCPTGIDENIPTENLTCPGYYRCHISGNCIHGKYLCDGIPHCPNKDDERYCDLNCPPNCTCEGYAYKCQSMIDPLEHLNTRYLDISGVIQPTLRNIQSMEYLLFLNLSHCELNFVNLTSMPRLQILDLSYNMLEELSSVSFSELTGLEYLSLSKNPFIQSIDSTFTQFIKTSGMIHLKELSLVSIGLHSIEDNIIASLPELTDLDLRQNDITDFNKNVFSGLSHLKTLHADNYKLCCSYFHDVAIPECFAPMDELSSCDDLLNHRFYQIAVWILAAFNIPANIAVLVYRLREVRQKRSKSFTILVGNLCLSDLLMGIYLVFIGSADVHYRNVWISKETEWTSSELCKAAGILAFLSSEVSAFVVCLITLERLLVMCFPLRRQLHMTSRSASLACALAWLLGLFLATLPEMVGWGLYGHNGFCLPLPITRTQFPGQQYVFAVFIYINFILFILIGIGQICIYQAIRSVHLSSSSCNKLQDMTIARRLMLIIVTDFLCWFPIGLMGVLSSVGMSVPGEVNVLAALFILPFNSALNPHLYTINSLLDRYREHQMERWIKKTITKINAEIHKWPADKVESLLKSCLQARVIQKRKVLQWMKLEDNTEGDEAFELEIARGCYDSQSDAELTVSHKTSGLDM